MEIKVRAVEGGEEKSVQEVEQELLDKVEQKEDNPVIKDVDNNHVSEKGTEVNNTDTSVEESKPIDNEEAKASELREEDILSFVKNKYGREIDSFEDIFSDEPKEDLPEDVATYLKFKNDTGRGINDFVKYSEDIDSLNPEEILARYYSDIESDLDADEIEYILNDKFGYDEDLDDESDIKKKNIAKKKELAKAKKHLGELKEKYSAPLESNGITGSSESSEELKAYKKYIEESKTYQEEAGRKSDWFKKKTEEVFNDEFKGFEFKMDDKQVYFNPSDRTELKNSQLDVSNFISKFVDSESGMMKDAVGYHRALSMAMNPDKYAKFFYEQGKSDAVENSARASKNIDMEMRSVPQSSGTQGTQVRSVGDTSGKGLRIRSNKK